VLVGSVGPLSWKLFAGRTIKVQRSFFETWLLPVGPMVGMLVGLAYLRATPRAETKWAWLRFLPGPVGALLGLVLTAGLTGLSPWALATGAAAGFALGQAAFSAGWMGIVRRRPRAAAAGLIHVGLAMVLLGLSGRAGLVRAQKEVASGSELLVGGRSIQYLGPQVRDDLESNQVFVLLHAAGRTVRPGLVAYLSSPEMPVGRTETIPTFWRDVQVRLLGVRNDGRATLQVVIHPLASWMWVGFGLMALAGLALLLRRPARPSRFVSALAGSWVLGSVGLGAWFVVRGHPALGEGKHLLAAPAAGLTFPAALALASLALWLVTAFPGAGSPEGKKGKIDNSSASTGEEHP